MKINRKTSKMSGKWGGPGSTLIIGGGKYGTRGRRVPDVIHMPATDRMAETKARASEIIQYASGMTKYQRDNWANSFFTTSYLEDLHGSVGNSRFQKKHDFQPGSWLSGFFYSNMLAAYSNMEWPRYNAPNGIDFQPMEPVIKATLDVENYRINGEIILYNLRGALTEARLRLWVGLQYVLTVKGTIYQVFDIGSGPKDNIVVPFTLDFIRTAGYRFGIENLALKDILFGQVFLWADCVAAHGPKWGPLVSPYSNIVAPVLTRRVNKKPPKGGIRKKTKWLYEPKPDYKVSELSLDVLDRLNQYNRDRDKRVAAGKVKV
ncbi:hypothetical protein HY605_00730, partial [Candidatus Peregrinibacteria bacterium]|nr:hypothetical protein [Candidatus Peregrinibacteria bacterium]